MRKIVGLFVLFLCSTVCVFAQGLVKGRVTDEKGLPVSFASIHIKGTKQTVSADADGYYRVLRTFSQHV